MKPLLLLVVRALAAPTGLQMNFQAGRVLGVDKLRAKFTWANPPSREEREIQSAAQIVVVESLPPNTVVYDSGIVVTGQPEITAETSLSLTSDTQYTWNVRVFTGNSTGPPIMSDQPAHFTTGLLKQSEWHPAQWIRGGNGATQMRKDFAISHKFTRATLFVAACHYYTLFLDGSPVGDQMLDGPWTNFPTNRTYATHAIDSALLAPGKHTLGIRVGQGFCGSAVPHNDYDPHAERSAIVRLNMHGANDSVVQFVVSDRSWTSSSSPIRSDSTYYGEVYDAREEQTGWASPLFTPPHGKVWSNVSLVPNVKARLSSAGMPPIKVVKTLQARSMTKVRVVRQGTCALSDESTEATVQCHGSSIARVEFVSFGVPNGDCSKKRFAPGACHSGANLTAWVTSKCVGAESCSLRCEGRGVAPASPKCWLTADSQAFTFDEGDPCAFTRKKLALNVSCTSPPVPPLASYRYVYDFGQEFAGVSRLSLPPHTPRGLNLTLKHAEVLGHAPLAPADGSVYMGNLFWSNPVDTYIAKGGPGSESYTPSFTYHGFRYVELVISGGSLPAEPDLSTVVALNLRSAVDESGALSFGSDEHAPENLLQKLSNNSWWTEAAALMSLPAGCAGRGERNGWTGDAAFGAESEMFDFGTGAFFSNYLAMAVDTQGPDGELGGSVPSGELVIHSPQEKMDPSWSAVFPVVAYNLWKAYNCTSCIDDAWDGLVLYYKMLQNNFSVSTSTYGRWGDWNPAYPPPGRLDQSHVGPTFTHTISCITAATMVVQNIQEAAEMARATGRRADADRYDAMLPGMRRQYHESFYDPAGQIYGDGTPTAFGCALWLRVTPAALLPAVVSNFERRLASQQYRLDSVGFIGVRYIFEALAKVNRTDIALRMLNVTAYPSFGYQITNVLEPATSLWESYDEPTMPQWVDESSRSHHYSASINTFMRKFLAGLDQAVGCSAWAVVKCRPEAIFWPAFLPRASARVRTPRGAVGCSWAALPVAAPTAAAEAEGEGETPSPEAESTTTPPASAPRAVVLCAKSYQFTGALSGPSPMKIQCPPGEKVESVVYAKYGKSDGWDREWYCFGPQPPPNSTKCEANVTDKIAPLCMGKPSCDLDAYANDAFLGDPCLPNKTLPLHCPPGYEVDYVEDAGDNGSCGCEEFCASDWSGAIRTARPQWKGAASLDQGTFKNCRCVQGSHYCPKNTSRGCQALCAGAAGGRPAPANYCKKLPPPAAVSTPRSPNNLAQFAGSPNTLMVRVACSKTHEIVGLPTVQQHTHQHSGLIHAPTRVWATVNATVPGGSRGEVHVPLLGKVHEGSITESGVEVWRDGQFLPSSAAAGVVGAESDGRFVLFSVKAGNYSFSALK